MVARSRRRLFGLAAAAAFAGCDACGNFFLVGDGPACAADAEVPRLADGARVDAIRAMALAAGPNGERFTVGATLPVTARFTLDDGSVRDALATDVRWQSDRTAIAAVDTSGIVTALSEGVVDISATAGALQARLTLRVRAMGWQPPTLLRLRVEPAMAGIHVGQSQWFWATADYSDGTSAQITRLVTWASSAPGLATIDPEGTARGVLAGDATISATYPGVAAGSAILTVSP